MSPKNDEFDAMDLLAYVTPLVALAILMLMVVFNGEIISSNASSNHELFVAMTRNSYLIIP